MRTPELAVVIASLIVATLGCDVHHSPSATWTSTGRVGVIDLDEIAKRMGRDVELTNSVKQRETALNEQLASVQASYEEQLTKRQEEFGEQPTEAQVEQLNDMRREATVRLNQARHQAQDNLNQYRAHLIRQFREEAKPVARAVAAERGLSIVITKNDSLLAFEDTVDITNEVADRIGTRLNVPIDAGQSPAAPNPVGHPPQPFRQSDRDVRPLPR